jgi:hypothetical protein
MSDFHPTPVEERAFFTKRLQEEQAALRQAEGSGSAWRHRRLVTRYEVVLSLYEGGRAG